MKYRNIDEQTQVSLLGFGCMRLPMLDNGKIDRIQTQQMVDMAIAGGINYFDTAYGYHGGESEPALGEALSAYPRTDYFLADKMPVWHVKKAEDAPKIFAEQLQRCRTNYFDFYLLHSVTGKFYTKACELGVIDYLLKEKAAGRIRRLGFSFHDSCELFEEILQAHPWDFCQIQFNYMDVDYQAGEKGLKLAGSLGIPVVVMEPLKGGRLAQLPEDFVPANPDEQTSAAVELAFRFVASYPEVKLILSGMSTPAQMQQNLRIFERIEALNRDEQQLLQELKAKLSARQRSACTACGYCMPCPFGVDIPENFAVWNEYALYGRYGDTIKPYFDADWDEHRADRCTACGACEALCPQHLTIPADLARLHEEFSELRRG